MFDNDSWFNKFAISLPHYINCAVWYASMYVHMYVCMYIRMYGCMYVRMCVHMYVCMCVCVVYVCCVCMYVCKDG